MKNFISSVILIALLALCSNSNAQIIEKGNVLIDAYYGWPNLWSNTAKATLTDANSQDISVGSLGPLGGRLEYLVSDKVGMGVEVNYTNTTVKWNSNTIDGNGNNVIYNYKVFFAKNAYFIQFQHALWVKR